jgi:FlaA1/EpsC-like NDP-sugar epimerase
MEMNINKAMFISTDKSIYPTNLYGATKMVGEKMWISANIFTPHSTKFSACRYGNVLGSRGSILEIFKEQKEKGEFTITHSMMNRFWISLPKAAEFILQSILETNGSEIFIPKMVSADILTIAKCIDEKCSYKEIGIKTGEKLEECLITEEESVNTKILNDKYVITKSYFNPIPFTYNSKNNPLFIKDKNKFKNLFKEEFNE